MPKRRFSKLWYLVGALILANVGIIAALGQNAGVDFAKLYFFDVGQGDAIYLRTLMGNDVLIDSGPGDAILSKLGRAMPFLDRKLEFVVLTHPHADHISGMIELLKRYKVEKVMVADVSYDSETYKTLLAFLEKKKVEIIRPRLGTRVYLDSVTVLDIYHPIFSESEKTPKDVNETSIVAKLSFGASQILLTGDSGKAVESLFLKLKLPLDSEILKVAHQGSRNSTSQEFLKAVSPDYAVIFVGKNPYGHPHEEVLGVLSEAGASTLRTDERGDISFAIYPDRVVLKK